MPYPNFEQWAPPNADTWLNPPGAVVRNVERMKQTLSIVGMANALYSLRGSAWQPNVEQTDEFFRATFEGPPGTGSPGQPPLGDPDSYAKDTLFAQFLRGATSLLIEPYPFEDISSTDPVWPGPPQGTGILAKLRVKGGSAPPFHYAPVSDSYIP